MATTGTLSLEWQQKPFLKACQSSCVIGNRGQVKRWPSVKRNILTIFGAERAYLSSIRCKRLENRSKALRKLNMDALLTWATSVFRSSWTNMSREMFTYHIEDVKSVQKQKWPDALKHKLFQLPEAVKLLKESEEYSQLLQCLSRTDAESGSDEHSRDSLPTPVTSPPSSYTSIIMPRSSKRSFIQASSTFSCTSDCTSPVQTQLAAPSTDLPKSTYHADAPHRLVAPQIALVPHPAYRPDGPSVPLTRLTSTSQIRTSSLPPIYATLHRLQTPIASTSPTRPSHSSISRTTHIPEPCMDLTMLHTVKDPSKNNKLLLWKYQPVVTV